MSKYAGVLFFVLSISVCALSYNYGPFILLLLVPVTFLLKFDYSETAVAVKAGFLIVLFNIIFYVFDVKLDLWSQNYTSEIALSILAITNILIISVFIFCFNRLAASKNKQMDEIIQKFQQEKTDIVKIESDINQKLKDYKLEFSQKLSVIKKLLESANDSTLSEKDLNDNLVSVFKNVLKLKKFIFFKYDEDKNSFIKLHEEMIEVSEIKHSQFLKWVLERSFNFPKDINLLTKDGVDRNPLFTKLVKEDKNFPDLFIPIKKQGNLIGFILSYDTGKNTADNEFKALATMLSEISSLIFKKIK